MSNLLSFPKAPKQKLVTGYYGENNVPSRSYEDALVLNLNRTNDGFDTQTLTSEQLNLIGDTLIMIGHSLKK